VHSKKIGTVLSVGLIHLFFVLMSRSNSIRSYALWVNLFFDEADVAAAGIVLGEADPPLARETFAWHKTTLTRF
jgi:hypothetical protein